MPAVKTHNRLKHKPMAHSNRKAAKAVKRVYFFGSGKADGT